MFTNSLKSSKIYIQLILVWYSLQVTVLLKEAFRDTGAITSINHKPHTHVLRYTTVICNVTNCADSEHVLDGKYTYKLTTVTAHITWLNFLSILRTGFSYSQLLLHVHAMAMCHGCELNVGLAGDVSIPGLPPTAVHT